MSINWQAVNRIVSPIKGYEDACRRCNESLGYPSVREAFNFAMPELANYTRLGVGSDPKHRYDQYAAVLLETLDELQQAGVARLVDFIRYVSGREKLENFVAQSGIQAEEIAELIKYLVYWFIPINKYLSGLAGNDPEAGSALSALREVGIRTNLDLLERGRTAKDRRELVKASGLPSQVVSAWVHRADLSRMPWASKATISNIMGAGYGSLAKLANADPEKLCEDFYRYGVKIGKNLKLGNEIENSQRIAKIVPRLVEEYTIERG